MTFADIVYRIIVPFVDFGIVPLLYALAFVFFLIGMVRFFLSEKDDDRKKGRTYALWSIIGFVVIFSVWNIVRILLGFLYAA